MKNKEEFATTSIHGGYASKDHHGSLSTPVYQTSTFTFETAEQGEARFQGEEAGFIYSRLGNPTVQALESRMAQLEEGESGLAFGSGMAAVSAVLLYMTKMNDHIVSSKGVYGCTYGLMEFMKEKYNIVTEFVDLTDERSLEASIRANTSCIYIESPINPTMQLIDLEMVGHVAKRHGLPLIVDNTFSSPYFQQPLKHGATVVLHSATKYISGHGDVIGGIAVGDRELMGEIGRSTHKDLGGILSPHDASLLLRGLKTLPIRMERHADNARHIFNKLRNHSEVTSVFFPDDPTREDYEVYKRQMTGPSGVISFQLARTKEEVQSFMNELKLIKIAVSLGDAETLIQHPATMTHAVIPKVEREKMGITDQLVRLSIGLEHWEDVWDDLEQALKKVSEPIRK
ncbi:methionine gamma-lyase [Pontibacillus halophilus JSM 076056 = DSM 19796]|uniref:homocysteine desulfhydrase n=1 Tax=Pontibacillus halophilus JSM 076056 = DSM 19796 TaxID=1385510 RepID=A0A0A5GKG0_9BACI|nr:aminotransferase class I/II-fold pyridoxal phosphate-dependent enzyme [Pontibacillus halophilus]KGX93771.1 methionine gamma-lyase [Pontibacillus halophilus JSM 076056 = DSM 19796]